MQTSPLIDQARRIKAQLPSGTVVLTRLGDFYEVFDDDAQRVADALGLVVTQRRGVRMTGLPAWNINKLQSQLLEAGFKVAIHDAAQ
jgi:DNA mismatch repair protein MutS